MRGIFLAGLFGAFLLAGCDGGGGSDGTCNYSCVGGGGGTRGADNGTECEGTCNTQCGKAGSNCGSWSFS